MSLTSGQRGSGITKKEILKTSFQVTIVTWQWSSLKDFKQKNGKIRFLFGKTDSEILSSGIFPH